MVLRGITPRCLRPCPYHDVALCVAEWTVSFPSLAVFYATFGPRGCNCNASLLLLDAIDAVVPEIRHHSHLLALVCSMFGEFGYQVVPTREAGLKEAQ